MTTKKPCVLIMAGGTGGHIFPALAVAIELQKRGYEVAWLGTRNGLEGQILSKAQTQNQMPAQIPLHYISIAGLRGKNLSTLLMFPFRLMIAFFQAIKLLKKIKPKAVLGMGGFVSGPGGLAAATLKIPLIIHEQNSIPGFTNQVLSKMASVVLETFPNSFPKNIPAIYTGLPVRDDLLSITPPQARLKNRSGKTRILILGGSRGALALNQMCPAAFREFPEAWRPEIWHQTGKNQEAPTQKTYEASQIKARVEPFIDNMAEAYAWADLVICRAGASTVTELMITGIGSILIPYPFAVDDHQSQNARYLEKQGAAILMPQSSLEAKQLANTVFELMQDRDRVIKMAENALQLAKRNALTEVVEHCVKVINKD